MAKHDSTKKTSKKKTRVKKTPKKKTPAKATTPAKARKTLIADTERDAVSRRMKLFENAAAVNGEPQQKITETDGNPGKDSQPTVPAQADVDGVFGRDVAVAKTQHRTADRNAVPDRPEPVRVDVAILEAQQQQARRAVPGKVNPARVDVSVLEQRYQKGRR